MMPVISRFHGIVIKMYFSKAEHNPPHIHAFYNGQVVVVCIQDGKILEGCLPPKELAMVLKWVEINSTELMSMWVKQDFHMLNPLE